MINVFFIFWFLAAMIRSTTVWVMWNHVISDLAGFSDMSFGDALLVGLLLPGLTVVVNWRPNKKEPNDELG